MEHINNFTKDLNLQELSEKYGISQGYLSNLIKEGNGKNLCGARF